MSAYIVDKEQIDYLIYAAEISARRFHGQFTFYHDNNRITLTPEMRDAIGRMLWNENVTSVAYRYPNDKPGEWPGPIGLDHETVACYTYKDSPFRAFSALAALKAIRSYEYQSCEHPDWTESAAYAFCDRLKNDLIYLIPGYDEAEWRTPERTSSAVRVM